MTSFDADAAPAKNRWRRLLERMHHLPRHTQSTLVLWIGAAMVGLVSVMLAKAAEWVYSGFSSLHNLWWWWPFVSLPLGGMAICWLMNKYGQGAESAGIPQTIASIRALDHPEVAGYFLNLRVIITKFCGIVIGMGSGFVMGREGPTVQIGASIMYLCRRFLPIQTPAFHRQLMVTGGAAGIAAAFNTPLAGIVFAFEELARSVEEHTSGKLIGAVILSGVVSLALLGNYTVFGHIHAPEFNYQILAALVPIAMLSGLLGGLLSWLCAHPARWLPQSILSWRMKRPYIYVAVSGLLIAGLGIFAPVFGSGGTETSQAIATGASLSWYYLPAKFAGLVISFLIGLPGGLFAPALALGAGVASWIAPFFDPAQHAELLAIGMVGMLAAVTRAPLTAAVIMMEMTAGHEMLISILASSMIAAGVARLFKTHLYSELSARILTPFGIAPGPDKH